jgi:hypothetical protein
VAGDVPAYLPDLVEAVGKANHDYFVRRGQNRIPWDELPPIYRHTAKESHLEILQDGPVEVIEREIKDAGASAEALRLRLDLFITELRGPRADETTLAIANDLEAITNEPIGE